MHVLYFHQHFSTPKGAAGIRSYQMARSLVRAGHSVTMVCGSYGDGQTGLEGKYSKGRRTGKVDGINVIEFDLAYSNADGFIKRAFTFLLFALKSIRIALALKYDVVFATTTPLTAGIPGIFARWLRRKPFVFEVRDLWPELPKAMGVISNPVVLRLMSMLEWLSYRSATRCIGLSPGIVEGIQRRGVSEEKILLIPNGCDLDIFGSKRDSLESVTPWRPEGVAEHELMAVFTGTHGIANGLSAVLDAAAHLKAKKEVGIKLVLVGQGRLKPVLQRSAQEGALDNVVFHDPVDKDKLAALMASANIGMQLLANIEAFYFGTSPNKFFDYLAAGLPVLNNYPGWVADLVTEHHCGYAVPPEDPQAFANALIDARDNRPTLVSMGESARLLAEREFDRTKLADAWLDWVLGATREYRNQSKTVGEDREAQL